MPGRLAGDTVRVTSYTELDDLLAYPATDGKRPPMGEDPIEQPYLFRGFRNASWEMHCSLMVKLGPGCAQVEASMFEEFRRYAVSVAEQYRPLTDWEWLAVAQHHGLPTRMLDWTSNRDAAIFFALDGRPEGCTDDAVIVVADVPAISELLPKPIDGLIANSPSAVLSLESLAHALSLQEYCDSSSDPILLFVEPYLTDRRFGAQSGALAVMSHPEVAADVVFARVPGSWRRIEIPTDVCLEARARLDKRDVTEFKMFPDLDNLGRWLHRRHRARLHAP